MTSYKSEICSHYKSHVLQNLSLPFLPALRLKAEKRWALVRPSRSSLHQRMNPGIVFIIIFTAITDAVIDFLDWSWRWREFRMVSIDQWWVLVSGLTQLWDVQRVLIFLTTETFNWHLLILFLMASSCVNFQTTLGFGGEITEITLERHFTCTRALTQGRRGRRWGCSSSSLL